MTYPPNITKILWSLGQKSWKPTELHETVGTLKQNGVRIRVVYKQYESTNIYRIVEVILQGTTIEIILPSGTTQADGTITPRADVLCRPAPTIKQYPELHTILTILLEHSSHR